MHSETMGIPSGNGGPFRGGDAVQSPLSAAFSLMDDWDLDSLFAIDMTTLPSSPPQQQKQSPPRSTTSTSTGIAPYTGPNRRKLEIQSLRVQSKELQEQLDRVTAALTSRPPPPSSDTLQRIAAWQECAENQRTQRQSLEDENERLREMLTAQATLARQLCATSRRVRVPLGLLPVVRPADADAVAWNLVSPSDHLAQLDTLCADMASIFDRPCYASERREFQEFQVLGGETNRPIVQSDIALVLPFGVDQVADALWHHTVRMSSHERVYQFQDVDMTPSSLVSRFTAHAKVATFERAMHGQIATRQYSVGGVRDVVSMLYAEVRPHSGDPFPTRGEGWLRCTPIHGGVARADGHGVTTPLTQVHWHRRIYVTWPAETTTSPQLALDAVAERVRETVVWNLQSVENRLLAQRPCGASTAGSLLRWDKQ